MPPSRRLRERVPGQSEMARVVAAQAEAPTRTPLGVVFGASVVRPHARAGYRSALAELRVGDVLGELGRRWDVLHDLPLKDGSLDHLVIGPAGVFAVRTVHCDGLPAVLETAGLTVGGEAADDLHRARADAEQVTGILGDASGERIRVRPLLVLVDARRFTARSPAPGVCVVPVQELARTLTRAPRILDGDEVAAVSDVADLSDIWPPADAAALDTQALRREFMRIRTQVRSALLRRVLWILGGMGILYSAVWALIGSFVLLIVS